MEQKRIGGMYLYLQNFTDKFWLNTGSWAAPGHNLITFSTAHRAMRPTRHESASGDSQGRISSATRWPEIYNGVGRVA